ncbi:sucrose synthase [Thiohalobacter sp. COW1]|uniref:Sucrose synthase n=1 Tax=Thiohalobacter thiocyanaticus TaxID=585455 RepID=A0A1Z4VMK1_9GAMM|nr:MULTISPECIES: sucrose synthase [Thiohalobacter]BAZ92662.1 sucrose synthase [Thiohalobacter thiocyanaticus]BCO32380.1 sucrose synthase [Thiohalobacter sp. COW1]
MQALEEHLRHHRDKLFMLLRHYASLERAFLLQSDLWDEYQVFCDRAENSASCDNAIAELIGVAQEAVVEHPWVYLSVRPSIARWSYLRFHLEAGDYETISGQEFLAFKERQVRDGAALSDFVLEVDLGPFNREFPKLKESRSIGRGVEFLNRRLSSQLFQELGRGDKRLLEFLRMHQCHGVQLMVNERITDVEELQQALRRAEEYLSGQPPEAGWDQVGHQLQALGLEIGWGRTVTRMRYTLHLLSDILEAPEPQNLERFLGLIPMIFSLVILSPHGFFGQANVLGKPDTGGQVVYILDQVRALEHEMRQRLQEQGLDIEPQILVISRLIPEAQGTTCDERKEHIVGTQNAYILRVPFRNPQGEVIAHWISRFEVWPYLETFAQDAERELLAELGSRPDLIIGNYSDGNLVATLLSQRLHVTQCNIAHALEKAKYLYSDLYWHDNESEYHFAAQFTADLIAMNSADFIITSTYQEIAGDGKSVGQYESYGNFTMPDLYRVVNGINVFDPKFNIVSPGADVDTYFPYHKSERRKHDLQASLEELICGGPGENARGEFSDPDKPLIFSMARLDHIKNITGLVQWYAECAPLRETANLLVVAGHVDAARSNDREEQAQIARMHQLMDEYGLDGQVRWLGSHLNKPMAGELYRVIADRRGVFVQPALFEAFGLTVIEAMSSGLPTFATRYGGPLEIIIDGESGFHIDPNHGDAAAERLLQFFRRCGKDAGYWEGISEGGINRVEACYTWRLYAERMMTLSRIYGFWKFVTNLERDETRRYLEMFYALQYRPLAQRVLQG